jgi:hypothetical protein
MGLYTVLVALLLSSTTMNAAEKWRIQYFYDKENSSITFTDIACPSARRCIASGVLEDNKHDKGVVAITSDSGANWQIEDVKDHPVSLFFLNENKGWMVTDRGIWETVEAGRAWKKIKDLKELERVYFVDENHGWAVGAPKLVQQTADGGKTWSPVAEAEKAPTAPDNTVYHWISFPTPKQGLIVGSWTLPHSPRDLPDWMAPDRAKYRQQYPSVTILLQTTDGGKTWTQISRTMDGLLTRFRFGPGDYGLALFENPTSAEVPSEVFKMDLKASQNTVVYRDPNRAVHDLVILPSGDVIMAATEGVGKSHALPIPGKLKMMRSSSLKTWIDMDVDYRAVAGRAVIAAPDEHNVWVATDTGMILKLQ